VTTFWRQGLLQYRKVPFGTNPSSLEREKQIINEDWETCFNSIHRRCVAWCSSWKLMRDFFCYKRRKKRKGNGVEVRRNIPRFTCDFVANERDTKVIILPQIVCVVDWGLGEADNALAAGARNKGERKSINRYIIKRYCKLSILWKLISAEINRLFYSRGSQNFMCTFSVSCGYYIWIKYHKSRMGWSHLIRSYQWNGVLSIRINFTLRTVTVTEWFRRGVPSSLIICDLLCFPSEF
jgi:hypothetical protein